jgi:hypothetical protein
MNPTRSVLAAEVTEVPVDMELTTSFKMKICCVPKTGVVMKWKI